MKFIQMIINLFFGGNQKKEVKELDKAIKVKDSEVKELEKEVKEVHEQSPPEVSSSFSRYIG